MLKSTAILCLCLAHACCAAEGGPRTLAIDAAQVVQIMCRQDDPSELYVGFKTVIGQGNANVRMDDPRGYASNLIIRHQLHGMALDPAKPIALMAWNNYIAISSLPTSWAFKQTELGVQLMLPSPVLYSNCLSALYAGDYFNRTGYASHIIANGVGLSLFFGERQGQVHIDGDGVVRRFSYDKFLPGGIVYDFGALAPGYAVYGTAYGAGILVVDLRTGTVKPVALEKPFAWCRTFPALGLAACKSQGRILVFNRGGEVVFSTPSRDQWVPRGNNESPREYALGYGEMDHLDAGSLGFMSDEQTVRVCDVQTWTIRTAAFDRPITAFKLLGNGTVIGAGTDNLLHVRRVGAGPAP